MPFVPESWLNRQHPHRPLLDGIEILEVNFPISQFINLMNASNVRVYVLNCQS